MNSLHYSAGAVKRSRPSLVFGQTKRYIVPGTEKDRKPLTAAIGFYDDGILRSVRSSDGRRYDGDDIALLIEIMEQAEHDGLFDLEVVIHYRKSKTDTTYATDFDTLRQHGQRVLGVSGWELSMPRCYWSIDGQPPTGPAPKPKPAFSQPALFALPVEASRRDWRGGY